MLRNTSLLAVLLAASPALSAPNTTEAPPVGADTASADLPPLTPLLPEQQAKLREARAAESSVDDVAPATVQAQTAPTKKEVAVVEPASTELRDAPTTPAPRAVYPQPTPRFDLAAGGFLQTRGLSFDYDPYADGAPPAYESNLKGFAVAAAVYPLPTKLTNGKLSGIGFSLKLASSVGSTMTAQDETGTGDYTVQHSTYDAAVHYRHLADKFSIDGELAFGSWSHKILDLPESIAVPDTSYTYVAAGVHSEIYPSEKATLGTTIRYVHATSSGDVMSEDWYGSGQAHAWVLGGDVVVPLTANLSLRGGVEWRRYSIELSGSGELSQWWGVGTIEDTSLTGSAMVGVQF